MTNGDGKLSVRRLVAIAATAFVGVLVVLLFLLRSNANTTTMTTTDGVETPASNNESPPANRSPPLPVREEDLPAAHAVCLCPPWGPRTACTLLLENVRVAVSNYYTYDLFVPRSSEVAAIKQVATACPVKVAERVYLQRAAKFRVQELGNSKAGSCGLCTGPPDASPKDSMKLRKGVRVSNIKSGGPLPDGAPVPYRFAMFRNAADEDVLWHLYLAPGFFQLLPARDAALDFIRSNWAPDDALPSSAQMILMPLRKNRRIQSLVKWIDEAYRLVLGAGVALRRGLEMGSKGDNDVDLGLKVKSLANLRPFGDMSFNPLFCCSKYIAIGQWHSLTLWRPKDGKALDTIKLPTGSGVWMQRFSDALISKAIAQFGDAPTVDNQVLYELREPVYEPTFRRWRAIREPIESSIFSELEGRLTSDNVILFISSKLSLQKQFHLVRSSRYIVAPEGSVFAWMLFSKPGTTWIMSYDHDRRPSEFRHSNYHAQMALYRCGLRLVIVETIRNLYPPPSLWLSHIELPTAAAREQRDLRAGEENSAEVEVLPGWYSLGGVIHVSNVDQGDNKPAAIAVVSSQQPLSADERSQWNVVRKLSVVNCSAGAGRR